MSESIIQIKNVNKWFGDFQVLKDINLEIPKGSFVGITGKSGCGKTTLVDLIMGLLKPQKGEIFIDDINLDKMDIFNLRNKFSYVGQDSLLLNLSIKENICLGDKNINIEKMKRSAALAHAELVATLQGDGPFTVFAPTDQAFADAGIDLDTFDTPEENETLVDILLYHVYSGNVSSTDVTDGLEVVMVNGDTASFTVADGIVKIGEATVTTADVNASNGIIHVIDKVLTPPVDPFEGIDCAATVGLTSNGYGFTPSVVRIDPGQTVCWSWTDATMGHNVKQVDGFESSTYVDGGVTSGQPATTVAFHHTFTENQTFYYGCEPHISMKMHGQVVVGDGGVQPAADTKDTEDAPGFVASSMMLAILGAVLFMSRRQNQ